MAQPSPWTHVVSDRVMDAQVIARRAVMEDGVVTPTEQAMLDALRKTQETIQDVHDEIQEKHREMVSTAKDLQEIAKTFRYAPLVLRAVDDDECDTRDAA